MTPATLAAWLLAAARTWSPTSDHDFTGVPRADTEARYAEIANDLAQVALDPESAPLFPGDDGRQKTALLMLSIASYESGGFRLDVDRQDKATGDGGHAWCLAQLHAPYAWGLTDRRSCFRAELRALHDSMALCPEGPTSTRVTGYTVGHCVTAEPKAQHRVDRAARWWTTHPLGS